jgi:hypothetical protein
MPPGPRNRPEACHSPFVPPKSHPGMVRLDRTRVHRLAVRRNNICGQTYSRFRRDARARPAIRLDKPGAQ